MSKALDFIQELLRPHGADGFMIFWAKEILGALFIIGLFWMLSQLICMVLNRWGRRITAFTATDLDDRLLQRAIPHVSRL